MNNKIDVKKRRWWQLLLSLVDGLFAGFYYDSIPEKWQTPPFNDDWPNSLFAALDPVAIDSVCYDFLLAEWPIVVTSGDGIEWSAIVGQNGGKLQKTVSSGGQNGRKHPGNAQKDGN